MDILDLLQKTIEMGASDLHLTVMKAPTMRINGELVGFGEAKLSPGDCVDLTHQILSEIQREKLEKNGEIDLSFSNPNLGRFRVNVYKQRGSYGIALRVVNTKVPVLEDYGYPDILKDLSMRQRGLVLVTGPTGSGKSTTLAAMINHVNQNRSCHVLTLEDPIEYLHKHGKSMINQREIGNDSQSYQNALKAALREDPDVILVGEMRDIETIAIAITAAETGHLVLSTLHTIGAAKTIDRIIDVFSPHQQQQIRIQLAAVLEGIVSQQLLPKADGHGRVAALEILTMTPAIRNLVREGKTHQIQTSIQTGAKFGMKTMDSSLTELAKKGMITRDIAITHAIDQEAVERFLF